MPQFKNKTVIALAVHQQAYPVGENKESYYIRSWFRQDVETGEITSEHTVIKNHYSSKPEPLFSGSYKQCQDHIDAIVAKEGMWERQTEAPWDYVLQPPTAAVVSSNEQDNYPHGAAGPDGHGN